MSDDFDVEIASVWDGTDKKDSKLAELRLKFSEMSLPTFWQQSQYLLLLMELDKELQPLADARFGKNRISVDCKELREGSVEVIVLLTAVGGALYAFFKDYKDLREGLLLFIKDVKAAASELQKIMKRHIKPRGSDGAQGTQQKEGGHRSS